VKLPTLWTTWVRYRFDGAAYPSIFSMYSMFSILSIKHKKEFIDKHVPYLRYALRYGCTERLPKVDGKLPTS